MTDFLIVGNGLAGNVLAHTLKNNQFSFNIIGDSKLSQCSLVAAGIWNPIVFKRMTKSWLADEFINFLIPFYTNIQNQFSKKIITHRPIIKSFFEEQEKQLWLKKSKNELSQFLDTAIYTEVPDTFKNCKLKHEFGIVKNAGNIDLVTFISESENLFKSNFINQNFNYSDLKIESDFISYKNVNYKNVIFCEGYLVNTNPYFNWIPLKPAKGETLTIETTELQIENSILNKNGFIFNMETNTFKVGATYEWEDLTETPTEKGKNELRQKLSHLISCDYQVTKHQAGIRPSSIDRRPIIGTHPKHKNLHIFNGLGTKGVMLAPYFANNFVHFYQQKQALINEVNVARFYNLYKNGN
jgi:glycine oxidase